MGSITKLNKDSNCSCSSCLFKSESDRQSIRNLLALGSRIDRLYYGKYIPLREKKLLKRLARTKAVYDDLRAPILSDSTLSIKRKRKLSPRNRLSRQKSSTLLQLANMRDQNEVFSSKNLSECCSCCSCSSKINIDDQQPKRYKRKQHYKGVNRIDRYKPQRGVYVGKKGVRFRAKHIRSDPCTCTFKLSGLLKKYSKTMFKKNRTSPPLPFDLESMAEENIKPKRTVSATVYQNLKHQKELVTDAFLEGVKKLSDSKTKIQDNVDLYVKKSVEKLKQTKPNNQKDNKTIQLLCECPEKDLVSQIKKDSLIKFKDDLRRKHIMKELECEPECDEHTCNPKQCREKLGQQESHKRKAQLRRNIDIKNGIGKRTKMVHKLKKTRNQKLEEAVSSGNSITIKTKTKKQRQADKKIKRNIQVNQSIKERNPRQAVRIGSSFSFNIEFYKNINEPIEKIYKPNLKGSHSSKQYLSTKRRNSKTGKTKSHNRSSQSAVNIKKAKKKKTILKRCFCTLSFRSNKSSTFKNKVIDDCKLKNVCNVPACKTQRLKHTQTEAFNDLHFSNRLSESKHSKKIYRKVKRPKRNQQFLPRVCDPGICVPDQCDPYNCIKIMNIRHTKVKNRSVKCLCSDKTKSTSSLTTRLTAPTTTNYVQSVITYTKRPKNVKKQKIVAENPNPNNPKYIKKRVENTKTHQKQIIDDTRQAVRIGSTFSFNIEFYKNKNRLSEQSTTRPSLSVKPKHKTKAQKKQKIQYRMMTKNQNISSAHHMIRDVKNRKNYKKNDLKIGLKKCFCTLKLQQNNLLKNKKLKMHSTATETAMNSDFDILMLNRGTKMDQKRLRLLEPFECEPFVCIPGDCDPYLCLERIKNRHKQQKDASSITKPRLREEGSTTNQSDISSKFIQVKPKLESKPEKSSPKAKLENFKRLNFNDSLSEDLKNNQSVNIGSSFSFNIEFKKSRSPTMLPKLQYSPKRKTLKNKTINNEILNIATHNTQMKKPRSNHKSSMIRPLIKRCFCTLNLQKKHKQHLLNNVFPNAMRNHIYTVNRILTKKTCHHYRYYTKNYNETHTNFIFNNDHIMSDLHPYPTKESLCLSEKMYNNRTIRSLRMFQSTVHIVDSLKINSKLISSNKTLAFNKNLALNSRKSYVTYIPSQDHHMHHCNNSKDAEEIFIFPPLPMQMQQNHMSQYYKKCFCTMNLQIENLYNTKFRNKNNLGSSAMKKYTRSSIHPQECEPGICIPGQCDPNECIKLIMKRGKNYKSIENNTGKIFTQSGSSNTYPFENKSTKTRKELLLRKNLSENRKEAFDRNDNRVVRIGSSFSFDIEFFKNSKSFTNNNSIYQRTLLSPYSTYSKIEKNKDKFPKPLKNLETRMIDQNYRNIQSQSELTSGAHKGSATLPILNRCFCTLKLQKKGKMYKKFGSKDLKPMLFHDQNNFKIKTASKGQNTKKIKAFKAPHQLKPFECEPNICDPDHCDPYQCLDIMTRNKDYKHVKNFGVDPVNLNKNKSIYSLNTKNKSKGSQSVRPYHEKPNIQQKLRLGDVMSSSIIPSKQAVRIGSNFSFNIEFFKDCSSPSRDDGSLKDNRHVKYISQLTKAKPESSVKPTSFLKKPPKGIKIKYMKHKKSQIQNIVKKTSSMTSTFVKRCFCTEKLQRSNDKNIGSHLKKHPNPSFFTKCLCWIKESQVPRLKLKNEGISNVIKRCFCTMQFYNRNSENRNIKTRTKSIMTENNILTTESLLPYECEPGICIPYQCNPYKCDKIIQTRKKGKQTYEVEKRSKPILLPYECEPLTCIPGECDPVECLKRIKKREYQTKTLGTVARDHMYTASTVTKSNTKSKNKINQAQIRNIFAKPNATTKEVLASSLPNRQAVRIGSKFSFDIQFYRKTNIPDLKSYATEKSIRQIKETPKNIIKIQKRNHKKQTPQQTSLVPVIPQIRPKHVKSEVHNLDLKSFYKKCFCILKLNKFKTKPSSKTKNQKTSYSNTNNTNFKLSKQPKLLPYECEPGVCIPGICDPFECKERIHKRNLKEFNQQTGNILRSKQKETKTMKRKSVKSQISKSVKYKEKENVSHLQDNNINKNVCRIGSEFSFEIEFFKNRFVNPDKHNIKIVDHEKHNNKSNRTSNTKLMHNGALQSNMENKNLKSLSIQSPLKRCFCTLRLQKFPDNSLKYRYHKNNMRKIKPLQRSVRSNVTPANLNTLLLNSPAKYGKRQRKSQSATSQVVRQRFDKGISMKTPKHKKKVQTNFIDKFSKKDNLKSNGRLTKAHILQKPYNKQALKIGSNVSFQIDFFKQRSPKTDFININHNHSISRQKRDSYSNPSYSSSRTSQMKRMQSRTKSLQVNKVLKRCFCTLKLQNMNSKAIKKNIPKLGGMQHYPQVLEVRRVSIQRQPKQIAQQTTSPVRTVATQSKNKKKKKVSKQSHCSFCVTSEYRNNNEMETILPYKPKKFNRSNSKTLLTRHQIESYHNVNKKAAINKKLTKQKSHKGINFVKYPKNDTDKKSAVFNIKKFFCQCKHLLSPKKVNDLSIENVTQDFDSRKVSTRHSNKSKKLKIENVLNLCQNERCPVKKVKINKELTVKCKKYKSCTQTECPYLHEKHTTYRDGNENISSLTLRTKKKVNQINIKSNKVLPMKDIKREFDVHCTCDLFREQTNIKMNNLCSFCQNKLEEEINRNNLSSPRLNVRFLDPLVTSETDFLDRKKKNKKHVKSSYPKSQILKRCRSCGRIINTEEIRKGAGDYSDIKRKHRKRSESSIDKLKRIFRCTKCHKLCDNKDVQKPAFDMILNSGNYNIINKDDVVGSFASLSVNKKQNKYSLSRQKHKKPQPCVCGSLICAEKVQRSPKNKKSLWKPCLCSSSICNRESAVMKGISAYPDQITCLCQKMQQEEMKKLEIKKQKYVSKHIKNRLKQQNKEDEIRRRKRIKIDKEREKQINKNSSDLVLCAESIIDIGKLGITAGADILRGVVRISSNPKQAIRNLKDMKQNPKLITRNLKIALDDSGVASTIKRVRLRCLAMRGVKRLKRVLESFPVTNYILHIADKDPKKRIVTTKRQVRRRERLDYGCSLYMGSLRQRPFLCIYDRCPWFYAHFLSLINLYKQFRDIMLFLLAVVFWSPCILCTEICRAMTCCIFCTG